MNSLQAHLLVAVPQLPDPNFYRTVVLMVQHNDEGALGVVLNRASRVTVGELWQEATDAPCACPQPVYVGGPVDGPLMAVHTLADQSDIEIMPGVYFSTEKDHLTHLVMQSEQPFRIFSGYSGWGAGQLEDELEAGGWLTIPARAEHVFQSDEELWKMVARDIGNDILFARHKHPHVPDDPQAN